MIGGTVVLEDVTIQFELIEMDRGYGVDVTVDDGSQREKYTVRDVNTFIAALATGLQPEGEPDWLIQALQDYNNMEAIQPKERALRFIP